MVASSSFTQFAKPALLRVRTAGSLSDATDDATLIQRFNGGDEGAFATIVARYREKMCSVAFSMLRNRSDAEEMAQDTFVRAHRGLVNFRGDSSLSTWLHRIVLNLSRNRYWYYFRRCRHTTRSLDCAINEGSDVTLADLVACDAPSPVRESAINEYSALVERCMERLGPGHRAILMRRNTLNWSYEEIATALGITIGTVKSRLARAREKLRALLANTCPELTSSAVFGAWCDTTRNTAPAGSLCA